MNTTLPELYSIAANGSVRCWKINVYDGWYTIEYGIKGGKLISATRKCTIKNIGKSNETTLYDQALAEAKSKWNKKKDEGYFTTTPTTAAIRRRSVLPMLAQKYNPNEPTITFPCYVQPKLDGIRALYYGGALWSRTGKLFTELKHITDQLTDVKAILDGELYSHELTFQEITSAVKRKSDNTLKLIYIVYDTVNEHNFPDRFHEIEVNICNKNRPNIKILKPSICDNQHRVNQYLTRALEDGYEGLMLRNIIGPYVEKYRSKNLQKYKTFLDQEFKIVDFTEGEGTEKGLIIFKCACTNGTIFSVRPIGTHEVRHAMYLKGDEYIGSYLTVKYQELTDGGVPRFPVGVTIRNYE